MSESRIPLNLAAYRTSAQSYTPFYCEENALLLARWLLAKTCNVHVVLVSNAQRVVEMHFQRAGGGKRHVVYWDYHVWVLCADAPAIVCDMDSTLGLAVPLRTYLAATLPADSMHPPPLLRVIDAVQYVEHFASTREHMRDPAGGWQAPPPAWPHFEAARSPAPITLEAALCVQDAATSSAGHGDLGAWCTPAELIARFA